MLGVLAAYTPRGVSRDKLVAWFWPEESAARARHFLADAVYVLRRALGRNAILAVGDDLVLNGEVVSTDVAAFREALGRGEHARAADLYAGPFFDGVYIHDAPELERWVEGERDRLAGEYARSVEALAAASEAGGDCAAAVLWWRRLAAHDPYDWRIALRLMRALDATGDRLGAVRHARAFEALFRREMGSAPAPAVRELADRPAADGGERQHASAGIARGATARDGRPLASPRRPRATTIQAVPIAAAILVVILAPVWWRRVVEPGAPTAEAAHGLVVVPFENLSGDSHQDYLGDGLTDGLIAELGRVEPLRVISRTSAMRYKQTTKPVPQIARELGVRFLVEGAVVRAGDSVLVTVELMDAGADSHMWTARYERPADEVLALQREIARGITRALRIRTRPAAFVAAAGRRVDPQAYELYLRGRQARNRSREGLEQAVVFFRRAIEREPGFAPAHAGLADAYVLLGYLGFLPARSAFPRGKAAAFRAIELDSLTADAYAAIGMALTWERDWWGAETAFRRSIALRPGYATGRQWYALLLTTLGRMDEALAQAGRASELDPLSLQINNTYGLLLYYGGDSAAALRQYRRIVEAEPDTSWVAESPWLLSNAARIYAVNGLYPEATAALERALALNPRHPRPLWDLAYLYVRMGRREDGSRAMRRADTANSQYPYYRASVHAALGELDAAFHWLERVEDWSPPTMSDLRMDPRLAALRADPRYARLLATLGLL